MKRNTYIYSAVNRALMSAVCVLMMVLACGLAPRIALARSYSIDAVDIEATVDTQANLDVVESRSFNFDGHFNGVYWDITDGYYEGRQLEITDVQAWRLNNGNWEEMTRDDEASTGDDGVYQIDHRSSYTRVKLFSQMDDELVQFKIHYRVTNAVSVWADTAELYWKFVSDGWEEPSHNVSCNIYLPVPQGEQVVPEQNVRAWGHGPLNGNVELSSDGVHYTVPRVGSSEFAEARISFPTEWVPDAEASTRTQLENILAEEQREAEIANRKRRAARRKTGAVAAVGVISTLASAAVAFIARRRHTKDMQAVFNETYWRDVPSYDHPAVLGALRNGGKPESKEFTATLMRLSDLKAVGLDLVTITKHRVIGDKVTQDYRINRLAAADTLTDPIDREADNFLFHYAATKAASDRGESSDGAYPSLIFGDLQKLAKKRPESYHSHMSLWEDSVEEVVKERGFFKADSQGILYKLPTIVAIINIFIIIVLVVATFAITDTMSDALPFLAFVPVLIAVTVLLFILAAKMQPRSSEAREIEAKMEALRRWLLDFTKLNEALPTDVTLWNRLLVMAVVLGVADKVIAKLSVVMPELFDNAEFARSYYWCESRGDFDSPEHSMRNSLDKANSISAAELAASSDSSGGGGGGGFSGGGGGGFGGGGGGGAF